MKRSSLVICIPAEDFQLWASSSYYVCLCCWSNLVSHSKSFSILRPGFSRESAWGSCDSTNRKFCFLRFQKSFQNKPWLSKSYTLSLWRLWMLSGPPTVMSCISWLLVADEKASAAERRRIQAVSSQEDEHQKWKCFCFLWPTRKQTNRTKWLTNCLTQL